MSAQQPWQEQDALWHMLDSPLASAPPTTDSTDSTAIDDSEFMSDAAIMPGLGHWMDPGHWRHLPAVHVCCGWEREKVFGSELAKLGYTEATPTTVRETRVDATAFAQRYLEGPI